MKRVLSFQYSYELMKVCGLRAVFARYLTSEIDNIQNTTKKIKVYWKDYINCINEQRIDRLRRVFV